MNLQKRFCAPTLVAAVMVTLFANSKGTNGQTAPVASIGTGMPSAGFLSAPGFKLSDIPAGVVSTDLNGDGKPDLVVAFAGTGKVVVYLGAGKGKFQAPVEYSVGGHPAALAAVDLNGDGQPDIVTANGADGTVSVLIGLAGGKLGAAKVSTVGVDANYLAATDLNGDGTQDIVIASRKGQALAILLNDSHGALQAATVQALGKTPTGIVTGDFNGDRHIDAAVASEDGTVSVLLGAGDGTLQIASSIAVSGAKILSLATADFNRDGNPDLVVTQADGRLLTTLAGKGDGTFATGTSYLVGNGPIFTATADVNGDGFVDLISVNQGSNTVSVLLGNGDGSFQNAKDFAVGDGPVAVVTGDFYSTGFAGLAVVDASAKTLNAIAGKGDGTFRAAPSYSGDLSPRAIASGDLNGDGLPDLVVTNFCGSDAKCAKGGTLSVYLGQPSGGYKLAATQAVGAGPVSVALADLNGDGNLDVLALNRGDKTLSVLLGLGDGTLQIPSSTPLAGSPVAVVAKDLNQDGKIDLAIVSDCGTAKCAQPGSVDVYLGGGDGSFSLGASYPVSYSPTSIAAGDLNGDSIVDLVVANACGKDATCNSAGTATILLGSAKGTFAAQADVALNNAPSSIALRSATAKGPLDIVVAHQADNAVAVLKGNGDGTFQTPAAYSVGASPNSLVIADLNGDGTPDVAVANAKDSTVSVLYGKSDGTLVAGGSYPVAAGPEALAVVASTVGARASLVTANGNSASSTAGTEITSLASAVPNSGSAPSSTSLAITATNPTVNGSVTLTATVTDTTTTLPLVGESVTFSSDGTSSSDHTTITDCGSSTTDVNGMTSCTTSELTAGSPRTVTATFVGDAIYAMSTGVQTVTVGAAATMTGVTSSPAASTVNQPVTFTAAITPSPAGPTNPQGTVVFTDGLTSATLCTVTVNADGTVPICPVSLSTLGTHTVTATYTTSDGNFTGSAGTDMQAVTASATTTTVTSSPAASTVNQPVTFTAVIAPAYSGTTKPQGTVVFTDSLTSATLCTVTVNADGTVPTCPVSLSTLGTHTVTATYTTSDGNFTGSAGTDMQAVTASATTTTVTSSPAASTVNQSVTFTALIAPAYSGTTKPQGMVVFTDGLTSATLCTVTVNADGTVPTCPVSLSTLGTHTVTATYTTSDGNFTGSAGTDMQAVTASATTTTVTSSPAASTVNQPVTFTAVIAPAYSGTTKPQGMVVFTDGLTSATLCTVTVNADGTVPTCPVSLSTLGTHTVTATYTTSDGNFTGSAGTDMQAVTASATTTTVTSSPAASTVNQSVTFTAVIVPAYSGTTKPQGMVVFTDGLTSATLCTKTVNADGTVPACPISLSTLGTHTVTATYTTSDGNFTGSAGTDMQAVTASATTTTVTSSPAASTVNQSVTFTAVIAPAYSGTTKPQGTVVFTDGLTSATLCTKTVNADGTVPACTTIFLGAGTHTVTATYNSSDGNFTGSSGTDMQVVNPTATTTTLASALNPTSVSQQATFTAVVTPTLLPGNTKPQGTLTFNDSLSTAALCLVTLAADGTVPPCMTSSLNAGTHTITGVFASSDGNFVTSMGSVQQVVTTTSTTLAFSASPASSSVNQQVTFTAVITPSFQSTVKPQGSVTFIDNLTHTVLCTVTVASDGTVPTCMFAFQVVGTHIIQATYTSSDTNFMGSSQTNNYSVGTTSTTTAVTSIPASSSVNQQVAFTATVTPSVTGTAKPQGTVTFMDGSTLLCTVTLATDGTVPQCMQAFVTAGTHTITATYVGNTNFGTSSGTDNQVVAAVAPMTTVTSSPAASFFNQQVAFTTVLAPAFSGTAKPQGTVTLTDSLTNATICTVTVASDGTVPSCSTALLSAGTHQVTAKFNTTNTATFVSSSGSDSQVVSPEVTATTVTSSFPNSAVPVDKPVTFKAAVTTLTDQTYTGTVSPSGGTVAFTDGITPLAGCSAVTVGTDGLFTCIATFTTATTQTTMHNITATYTPSSNPTNFTTSSGSVAQVVGQAVTSIMVVSALPTSTVNQAVTFTATLTAPSTPTGTITFTDLSTNTVLTNGNLCLSAAPLPASGTLSVTCTYPFPAATKGSHSIQASYSGDANFSVSSNTAPQVVNSTVTTLAVTSLQSTSSVNQSVGFTIVLTPSMTGATKPQGTVTLTDALTGAMLCSPMVAADGTVDASLCQTSFTTTGTHQLNASFVPNDGNFVASSTSLSQIVMATNTTVIVTSSSLGNPPASVAMQPVTFTATVTPTIAQGSASPAGTVTFTLSSGDSCKAVPVVASGVSSTAACMVTFASTVSGSVTVSAVYTPSTLSSGLTNFLMSASSSTAPLKQTVLNFTPTLTAVSTASAPPPVITQGFSNVSDPFNASTITLTSASPTAFSDKLTVTSCVITSSTGAVASGITCTPNVITNTGIGNIATFTIATGTTTPIGAYTVTVMAANSRVPALVQQTSLTINVAAQVVTSSLSAGATTGAFNVPFGVPAASANDTFSFACGAITYNSSPSSAISCTVNPTTGTLSASPFTITASTVHAMTLPIRPPSQRIFAAALFGVPLFALLGCLGRRGSRKSFLRFLAALTVMAVASQAIGCGGGFTTTSTTGSSTGPAIGTYFVLVTATDTRTQLTYDAVITVAIRSASGS